MDPIGTTVFCAQCIKLVVEKVQAYRGTESSLQQTLEKIRLDAATIENINLMIQPVVLNNNYGQKLTVSSVYAAKYQLVSRFMMQATFQVVMYATRIGIDALADQTITGLLAEIDSTIAESVKRKLLADYSKPQNAFLLKMLATFLRLQYIFEGKVQLDNTLFMLQESLKQLEGYSTLLILYDINSRVRDPRRFREIVDLQPITAFVQGAVDREKHDVKVEELTGFSADTDVHRDSWMDLHIVRGFPIVSGGQGGLSGCIVDYREVEQLDAITLKHARLEDEKKTQHIVRLFNSRLQIPLAEKVQPEEQPETQPDPEQSFMCLRMGRTRAKFGSIGSDNVKVTHKRPDIRLLDPPPDSGILRCRGYVRYSGGTALIFHVPLDTQVKSLRDILWEKPTFDLKQRVDFAKQLATSVLIVHSLGMVHKRIRPESIAVLKPKNSDASVLGLPYLVSFGEMRKDISTSGLKAISFEIRESLYTHPRHLGPLRRGKFRMLDDIYSLGVCLLEFGLMESLLILKPGLIDVQTKEYDLHPEITKSVKNVPWTDSDISFLGRPIDYKDKPYLTQMVKLRFVKAELEQLAMDRSSERMGPMYMDAVLFCLRCFELWEEQKDTIEVRETQKLERLGSVAVNFIETILAKLQAIVV